MGGYLSDEVPEGSFHNPIPLVYLYFSSFRTNRNYQCFTNVWLCQVLDLHVVLHCPFIGFEEDHI